MPQFGGFCAFGIAKEPEWTRDTLGPPANPDYWKFVGDELYLFEACQAEYQFDLNVSEAVKMGKDRWHSWFGDHFYSHMAMNTLCLNFDGGDDDCAASSEMRRGGRPAAVSFRPSAPKCARRDRPRDLRARAYLQIPPRESRPAHEPPRRKPHPR